MLPSNLSASYPLNVNNVSYKEVSPSLFPSLFQRVKSCFSLVGTSFQELSERIWAPTPFEKGRREIANLLDSKENAALPEKFAALFSLLPAHPSKAVKLQLGALLERLEPALLDRVLVLLMEKGVPLEKAVELLSLEQLQQLVLTKQGAIAGVAHSLEEWKQTTSQMLAFLPEETDGSLKKSLLSRADFIIEGLSNVFHTLFDPIVAAADTSPQPPSASVWIARERVYYIYQVIEKPLEIFQWLVASFALISPTSWAPRVIAGAVLLISLITVKLLQYFLSGLPSALSGDFPNLVLKAQRGELEPVVGRHQELQQLIDCLGDLDKHSRRPLLLGQSGSGKTEIVKALAIEIAAGKHPHLKGKAIYAINTANLMQIGGGDQSQYASRLEILLKEIKGNEEEAILFFDEVHSLFAKNGATVFGNLSQEFKSLLDNPKINCLAATTSAEYEETIKKDDALDRRFRPITVAPLDKENCCRLLSGIAQRDFTGVGVDKEALERALELTDQIRPNVAQPAKAKDLVIEAIQSVSHYKGSEVVQLAALRDQFAAATNDFKLRSEGFSFSEGQREEQAKLTSLAAEITSLEKVIADKNGAIKELRQLRLQQEKTKEKVVKLARQLHKTDLVKEREQAETLSKSLFFFGTYLTAALQENIAAREQALALQGVAVRVNKEVVERVFLR